MLEYGYEQIDERQEKSKRLILALSVLPLAISCSLLILFFLFPTTYGLFDAPSEIDLKEVIERGYWRKIVPVITLFGFIISYKVFIKTDLRLFFIPFFGIVFSILLSIAAQMFSQRYFDYYFNPSPYFHFELNRFITNISLLLIIQSAFSLTILSFISCVVFVRNKILAKFARKK